MASNIEIRVMQKSELFDLLKLKRDNQNTGNDLKGLNDLITKKKAIMEAEDVAYVEKMVAELE